MVPYASPRALGIFITTGNNGAAVYGWRSGASADRAVATCSSQGFTCQKPIGGYVK